MEVHNQLGTDLVANAVAAVEKYQAPIIMIEMGTATTISYISRQKTYEGGMMFPGGAAVAGCPVGALGAAAECSPAAPPPGILSAKTPRIVCATASSTARQGMLDGIIDRMKEIIPGENPTIVATGSNAPVIVRYCRNQIIYDKYLLMEGLQLIYLKNREKKIRTGLGSRLAAGALLL